MLKFRDRITKKWLFIIASIVVLFLISAFLFSLFQSATKLSPYPGVNMPTKKLIPGKDYVTAQVSVKFKKDISKDLIETRLSSHNVSIISTNEAIGTTLLKVPEGKEMEVMQKLSKDGIIEFAEYNYTRERRFTPNDPSYGQQWHLKKIQADKAWDVTRGAGIKIAVVDSGVDVNHPDLKSKIAATKGSVTDSDGHGTHVAGIMAAATNNAIGIASVCPDCKILAAKDGGNDTTSAASITWAADQGAKAINMSWGGSQNSSTLKAAIDYAFKKGALPVAAVQNENINDSNDYPSSYANVMSVTNSTSSDVKFTQAGYGTWVWIAAPGTNIYSTVPGSKYQNMSGTSMATPVVVGAVGLVASTSFGSTPTAVRQRLCSTADKITGTGTQFKCGRVNVFKAVGNSTPTSVPTNGATNAPTQKPAATPTKKPISPTVKPTQSVPVPSSTCLGSCPTMPEENDELTKFAVQIFLHGIGNSGDNTNPILHSFSNKNPKHKTRNATVYLENSRGEIIAEASGEIKYHRPSGSFKGVIQLDSPIQNGVYTIKLKSDYHLPRIANRIQSVNNGNTYNLSPVHLVAGNTDNDEKLDVLDYSLFLNCFGSISANNCTDEIKLASDLNDDGIVNSVDYNLFIREISVQSGG